MCFFFFFNDTATTEIYTLSLHDALPISGLEVGGSGTPRGGCRRPTKGRCQQRRVTVPWWGGQPDPDQAGHRRTDRKSTRLNSSHANISYAVFCLKKKKNNSSETSMILIK